MKNNARITSILKAPNLGSSITGWPTFDLAKLDLATDFDFQLPTDLRLGHLAEKVVSILIKSSTNYEVLYENIQLVENKRTIGEIDFILSNQDTKQLVHLELAYKFYLYDPSIAAATIKNWIGPNRNDSLQEKLDKLKNKQFPLLFHHAAQSQLDTLELNNISQQLCLLASLFVPYQSETHLPAIYQKAIKGYYLSYEDFMSLDHSAKSYYLPQKREWGIDPTENADWKSFGHVHPQVKKSIAQQQAPLCWQKYQGSYTAFFIVWW
ncbi:MAG: DUF1853 family protein [Bacteroidota bacterium]